MQENVDGTTIAGTSIRKEALCNTLGLEKTQAKTRAHDRGCFWLCCFAVAAKSAYQHTLPGRASDKEHVCREISCADCPTLVNLTDLN